MSETPSRATTAPPDVIDAVVSIAPGSRLDALRRVREEARLRTQTSYEALFAPSDFGPLAAAERLAIAERVAAISGSTALAGHYRARLDALALGGKTTVRLPVLLAHADNVARSPGLAGKADLVVLSEAGLSPAAIVALSQIIGFVAYQARAAASFALIGERA